MIRKQEENQNTPRAVDLIARSLQLYEFHEATGEEDKLVCLTRWLNPAPDRSISIAASSTEHALTYINSHMPDFRVRSVTPMGSVIVVIERS